MYNSERDWSGRFWPVLDELQAAVLQKPYSTREFSLESAGRNWKKLEDYKWRSHRTPSLRRKPLWWFSAATPQRQAPTTPSHHGRLPGDATLGEDLLQVPTGRAFFPAHGGADLAEAVSSGQYHRKGTLRGRGHPDGNDADRLAEDPMHKLLVVRDPVTGRSLRSQPTLSRFYGVGRTALYRLGREQAVRVIGAASAPTARSGAVTTITWTRPTTPRTARRSCPSSTATTGGGATCRCWRS